MARGPWKGSGRPGTGLIAAGVAIVALAVVGFNAYASFTGTDNKSENVSTGTVTLSLSDDGVGQYVTVDATDVAPGDTIDRLVNLDSGGTVAGNSVSLTTLETDVGAPQTLYTNDANGLQLRIDNCDVSWNIVANQASCPDPTDVVYAPGGNPAPVNDSDSGVTLTNVSLIATNHLRIRLTVPGGAGNAYQNQSVTIKYTFALSQRAGTFIG
ncbi:MAG TPA: TasA family protein [Acidimicrobiia bacterium]|nr:TasA family protein [Acidimicrobiia bacterium]